MICMDIFQLVWAFHSKVLRVSEESLCDFDGIDPQKVILKKD